MPVIGTFSAVKDGYAGNIRTLMLNGRVRILANDRKDSDGAPDFRISLGMTEIGAAWRRTKQGTDQTYLRVRLDDPAWPQPVWGVLLESSEDGVVRLIWSRDRRNEGSDNAVTASTHRRHAGERVPVSTALQTWLATRIGPPRCWTRQQDRRSSVNRRAAQPHSPAWSCSCCCRS
jgi:uncharacterized protein (DUF736 family)